MSDNDNINISMPIGAETCRPIAQKGVIQGPDPTVVKSKLGYLLQDHCTITTPCQHLVYFTSILYHCVIHQMLCLVEMCGKLTVYQTIIYLSTGIYAHDSVTCQKDGPKFPRKPNHPGLPYTNDEYGHWLINSMICLRFTMKQLRNGFIERVPYTELSKPCHYIPHHGVRKDLVTTPLRIPVKLSTWPVWMIVWKQVLCSFDSSLLSSSVSVLANLVSVLT